MLTKNPKKYVYILESHSDFIIQWRLFQFFLIFFPPNSYGSYEQSVPQNIMLGSILCCFV